MDAKDSSRYFSTFYTRRFFRIIPVYFAWIAVYILVARFGGKHLLALSHSGNAPPLGYIVYDHYLFLQNFYLEIPRSRRGLVRSPPWSLAVEEQFYLVIPLLGFFLPRRAYKIFLYCVILLSPILRIVLLKTGILNAGLIGQLTFTRADVLAVGALAVLYWREANARTWLQNNSRTIYAALFVLFLGVAAFWKWCLPTTATSPCKLSVIPSSLFSMLFFCLRRSAFPEGRSVMSPDGRCSEKSELSLTACI